MYFLGVYDVNRDQLWGLPYEHQTQGEVLDFLMQLRQRYPEDQRLMSSLITAVPIGLRPFWNGSGTTR